MKLSDIKPNPKNPRIIKDDKYEQLKKSIEEFPKMLELRPIVIDKDNVILGGNMRYRALQELGYKDVPVVRADDLTEEEKREFIVKDNLPYGSWDWDELANEYELSELEEWGLDVENKAFLEPDEKDDEVPEIDENEPPKAKLGDIYQLGDHKIMCGDSTKKEDVEKLMDGQKADMVFTDPPYNVNYSGRGKETSNTIENDNQTEEEFRVFLNSVFKNYYEFTKETAPLYCCYASKTHREFEDELNKNDWEVRNQIIWVKLVASMGWGDYRWKHEPILYCYKGGQVIDYYGDRKQYTQWDEEKSDDQLLRWIKNQIKKEEDGNSTVWRFNREHNYKHPTQKPVALVSKAILNSSKNKQLVLDLFLGSGATLISADKFGRKCYGMELDPKYVDVIIQRWEEYTGQDAKKVA